MTNETGELYEKAEVVFDKFTKYTDKLNSKDKDEFYTLLSEYVEINLDLEKECNI